MRRGRDGWSRPRPWWRTPPTVIAVVGLLAGLAYNGVSVTQQLEQARETRLAAQIGLLTQLDAAAVDSEHAINASRAPEKRCDGTPYLSLDHVERAALFKALGYYEYLAWLFNDDHLTMDSALDYWRQPMITAYDMGTEFYGRPVVEERFPQLGRFRRETAARQRPAKDCAP
jgi:hypothetical protein